MSDWTDNRKCQPEQDGRYLIKYETWRYRSVIDSGECEEDWLGYWEMTEGEQRGEEYREITHWKELK